MHMRQFISAHDHHGWIKFWRLFWSDLEACMMVLCNFLRRWKVCAHIRCLCTVKYLIHSFYPNHFLVLASIACDIVVIWESTYLSRISSPAANMHSWMCGPYYQHQGWTILMMFVLTANTITIWLYYLMNTIHFIACSIWYDYNTIWQKMYHNCIWTALECMRKMLCFSAGQRLQVLKW